MDFEALMLKKSKQALPLANQQPSQTPRPSSWSGCACNGGGPEPCRPCGCGQRHRPPTSPDKQKTKENTWSQGTTSFHETQSKMLSVRLHR